MTPRDHTESGPRAVGPHRLRMGRIHRRTGARRAAAWCALLVGIRVWMSASGAAAQEAGAAGAEPGPLFEVAAWVDHFDFATFFDSESEAGLAGILDHVAETGANLQFFRSSGNSIRHPSAFKPSFRVSLDKRKGVMGARLIFDWVDYNRAEPDVLALALRLGRERGMRPGIHWPFEECHAPGYYKAFMAWNMDHPQFWGRTADGQPWLGRVSLCYPEVIDYKLAILDELLDRGAEVIFIDMFRAGMWGPWAEYVPPVVEAYRKAHGEEPPADETDLRWCQHVADYVTEFFRRMRSHLDAVERRSGRRVELFAGVPGIAPIGDGSLIHRAADWRTWVDEGIIDGLVMHSIDWDTERPFETYREYGRQVMAYVDGRCKVHWPLSAYSFRRKGLRHMASVAKLSQAEVAGRFMTIAWEEGASGVSMECVDYNNYQAPTRETIARLAQTPCRTVRPWAHVKAALGIVAPERRPPRPRPALAEALMVDERPADGLKRLAVGPGNNTEPAYSPDGTHIAFQSDRDGIAQIYVLDLDAGTVKRVDTGPGFCMFPAWIAGGTALVYSHGHFPKTAFRTVADAMPGWNGSHLNTIDARLRESLNGVTLWKTSLGENARPEQLTSGLVCDMLPAAGADAQTLWFSSTRGVRGRLPDSANTMLIQRRDPDGSVRTVYRQDGAYAVQPTSSPDGAYVAFARITSFAGMWHIMIARDTDKPGAPVRLTPAALAAYAPRWSPDGRFVAFTGYREGDPGWGLYVMRSDGKGNALRVPTGLAQTRSPSWSPDGGALVFEARQGTRYSLCTLPVSPWIGALAAAGETVSVDRLFARRPFLGTDADDDNGIAQVFDGDPVSHWRITGAPRWIEARFPEPVTIAGVNLHHGMPDYAKYPSGASSAKGYRLQACVDEVWQDLVPPVDDVPRYRVGQPLDALCRRHEFTPVTTQCFRLVVTATNDTGCRVSSPHTPSVPPGKRVVYLREIELLDSEGQPVIR